MPWGFALSALTAPAALRWRQMRVNGLGELWMLMAKKGDTPGQDALMHVDVWHKSMGCMVKMMFFFGLDDHQNQHLRNPARDQFENDFGSYQFVNKIDWLLGVVRPARPLKYFLILFLFTIFGVIL